MPRTLVVSDLHLGMRNCHDALRTSAAQDALATYLQDGGFTRLVLLGDAIELRHGPTRDALAAAEPCLRRLGEALGADGTVVLVPGNHDHQLIAPWLAKRGQAKEPPPLKLDDRPGRTASYATGVIAKALAPATLEVRYPGLWLRDDVYAMHGHYLDCLFTMPTAERVAVGAMARVVGEVPESGATPDDFEAQLAPLYAWTDAIVHARHGAAWSAKGQQTSKSAWTTLNGESGRIRARALGLMFAAGVASLNRAGIGPVRAELSGHGLRQAGLRAINDVVRRLGIEADHVVFGHTHRAGPLPEDHRHEWQTVTGAQLHNAGSWTVDPTLSRGGPDNPYAGGRAIVIEDEGPPQLVRVAQLSSPDGSGGT